MTELTSAAADYRAALFRFVHSRVRDHAAAEDIVHDVLLRALERQSQLRDDQKLAPWLYQMTRNAIVDHHRGTRPMDELPQDLVAPEPEPQALSHLAQCLTPLIARLPEPYRTAFRMSEVDGVTQQEVAKRLGISLSGAKSRVQRARAKLQELVLTCCKIERDHRGAIMHYERSPNCGCGM
ncbi:MAG TPA: RNA polymerase sigma factor SigZ [Thermoanaerobaculia bacterium]|nr:RNA polymerase sigma factor SigZ [Thermoanaerobaculia bacterium]